MKKISKTTRSNIVTYAMVILAFVIMQSLIAGGQVSSALKGQLVPICVYICMAISLNLTVGILGELSLGHAGFMSVGAFTGVIAAMSLHYGSCCRRDCGRARSAPSGRLSGHCHIGFW